MTDAPRYEIHSVVDFLKVPEDRIEDCLAEFSAWVQVARAMFGLWEACGGTPEQIKTAYHWIDDGKRDASIRIRMPAQAPEE